nr:uncharacterized mitochondrial protein AtMg00810-like [Tanacetum cinerariifolium]
MFDEYLNPTPCVNPQVPAVIAPKHAVSSDTPSSTIIDQDTPSTSTSQTNQETPSSVIPLGVEEANHDIKVTHIDNNPYTKYDPLDNVIGDSSSSVSTRHQLQDESLFCYFNAFLSSVEPTSYKEALIESYWIEAMQEELNEFERLEVWELVPHLDRVMIITLKSSPKEPLILHCSSGDKISKSPKGIFLNQSKYALKSLEKYGMETCDPVNTSMVEKSKLDEDPQGKAIDPIRYHGMIDTLMYFTSIKPDLIFVMCMCAQYQAKPIEKHLYAVKRIFRYLRGT